VCLYLHAWVMCVFMCVMGKHPQVRVPHPETPTVRRAQDPWGAPPRLVPNELALLKYLDGITASGYDGVGDVCDCVCCTELAH